MTAVLRIVRTSSREKGDLLTPRLGELRSCGFEVRYQDVQADPSWLYTAGSANDRANALAAALLDPADDFVIVARGGYGASDLLPLLPWEQLKDAKPKIVVGFSDVSALHSAFYTRLGWPGLHAPMPATELWRKDGTASDVESLLDILRKLYNGDDIGGQLDLASVVANSGERGPFQPLNGRLFGGCFSVLTNLIGTSSFPKSLTGHIVFIEDIDESPARLMRYLNQWIQAGTLVGVQAIVVGNLRNLGANIPDSASFVLDQFAMRSRLPVFHSPNFGHTCPNFPLMLGAEASIAEGKLSWRFPQ